MAEKIPWKIGQMMLEMRGAVRAAVDHEGGKIVSVDVVRHWYDQLSELFREYEVEKPEDGRNG